MEKSTSYGTRGQLQEGALAAPAIISLLPAVVLDTCAKRNAGARIERTILHSDERTGGHDRHVLVPQFASDCVIPGL